MVYQGNHNGNSDDWRMTAYWTINGLSRCCVFDVHAAALFGLMGALSMAALRGHLSRYEISSIAQTLALNAVLMVAFGGSMDIW